MASAKSNMSTITCLLTEAELGDLCEKYDLAPEYGVQLPRPDQTAMNAPPGKITLYTHFFATNHFRIPVGRFLVSLLRHYKLHITHDSPSLLAYTNSIYSYLHKTPNDLQEISEDALAATGISRQWDSPGYRSVFSIGGKGKFS
jgi:hypothetical protein